VAAVWVILVVVFLGVIAVYLHLLPSITLRRINRVRAVLGWGKLDKLLGGARCDGCRCPVANSLDMAGGVEVGRISIKFHPMRYQSHEVRDIHEAWGDRFRKRNRLQLDISTMVFTWLFDFGGYQAYRSPRN